MSREELARIGETKFSSRNKTVASELMQITELLKAVSFFDLFRFPLTVRHTGESEVPDFEIRFEGYHIAVEVAKVTTQDLEHAHAIHDGKKKGVLHISGILRDKDRPRSRQQVFKEAFPPSQQFVHPISRQEHRDRARKAILDELDDKTSVLNNTRFRLGDENWLVFHDRIGISEDRVQEVGDLVASYWKPAWYSKVFLQQEHFDSIVVFQRGISEPVILRRK